MKKLIRRRVRFKGLTLGLDLHKKFIQFSVMDPLGDETDNDRIASDRLALLALIDSLTKDGQSLQVSIEACGCFMWVYDELVKKLGHENVHVAAPSKVRVIAESGEKNDANDAWWLAYLLFEGRLPKAHVVEGDMRELRTACRQYQKAINTRSDFVRQMHSELTQLGIKLTARDFKSAVGRARIQEIVDESVARDGMAGQAVAMAWERFTFMTKQIKFWGDHVKRLSAAMDKVQLIDEMIPGVGQKLAAVIFSEAGDPSRYKSAKAFAKSTGLIPGYRESGGKRTSGGITRAGNRHLRWAFTQAVVACLKCKKGPGKVIKEWVNKLSKRKRKKAAIVAAARKLAESLWRMFALGEAFDPARAFGGISPPAKAG